MDLITDIARRHSTIKNSYSSIHDKNISYAKLMSTLEAHYHIPLLMQPEYHFENEKDKKAFELWLLISNSREF